MKKFLKLALTIALITYALSWLPLVYVILNAPLITSLEMTFPETTEPLIVPRGIVFGGRYTVGEPLSELNQERLLAAIKIYEHGMIQNIVVSNTQAAAIAMKQYLLDREIPENHIEMDSTATITEDSCKRQSAVHPKERTVLISHRYHLPRALYLCSTYDVSEIGFPAELIRNSPSHSSWLNTASIRAWRYQREAILLNLFLLGFYK